MSSGPSGSSLRVKEREQGLESASDGRRPGRLELTGPEKGGHFLHSKGNSSLDVGRV